MSLKQIREKPIFIWSNISLCSYILRRKKKIVKSPLIIWLVVHRTNNWWRSLKILWPSQNIWTLCQLIVKLQIQTFWTSTSKVCLWSRYILPLPQEQKLENVNVFINNSVLKVSCFQKDFLRSSFQLKNKRNAFKDFCPSF